MRNAAVLCLTAAVLAASATAGAAASRSVTVVNRTHETATIAFSQADTRDKGSATELAAGTSRTFTLADVPTSVRFFTPGCRYVVHNLTTTAHPLTVTLGPDCRVAE